MIADLWECDLPQQFHDKKNIQILISAISRQLEEVAWVFHQLNSDTDIDTAVGKQLDMLGNIIGLTRKEAGILNGTNETVIEDNRYRQYLRYKILLNTNDCTYNEVISGLQYLLDVNPIYYHEREDYPATIFLELPKVPVDTELPPMPGMLLRPSGVGLVYSLVYNVVCRHVELIDIVHVTVRDKVENFRKYLLDGSSTLNGTQLLCGAIYLIPAKCTVHLSIEHTEDMVPSILVENNPHFCDGELTLNGSVLLDSVYEKEELT